MIFQSLGDTSRQGFYDSINQPQQRIVIASDDVSLQKGVQGSILGLGQLRLAFWRWSIELLSPYCGSTWREAKDPQAALLLPPSMTYTVSIERDIEGRQTCSGDDHPTAITLAQTLFQYGAEHAAQRGLLLAQATYLFAEENETLLLAAEAHTPETARYWYSRTFEDRRKQGISPNIVEHSAVPAYLRQIGYRDGESIQIPEIVCRETLVRMRQLYTLLTGQEFTAILGDPTTRLQRALGIGQHTARLWVTPRANTLDPQGLAIAETLQRMGFAEVREVRIGRAIEITLDIQDPERRAARIREMSERLLANVLVEDVQIL